MAIGAINKPGRHAVGKNLYLQIGKTGSRSWLMKFMLKGKSCEMALGACDVVSLKDAREKVFEAKRLIDQGIDPIEHRKQDDAQLKVQMQRGQSFRDVAEEYMRIHVPQHENAKHRKQWSSTLKRYVFPVMGDKAIIVIGYNVLIAVHNPGGETSPSP